MDPFDTSNVSGGDGGATNGNDEDHFDDESAVVVGDPEFFDGGDDMDGDDLEPVVLGQGEDVMSAILGGGMRGPSMDNLSVRSTSPAPVVYREEPETIKAWRLKQQAMLEEKDAKEVEMMKELKEKAKKELHDWYKKYEEQLAKTMGDNRKEEKTFVAEMDEIVPGTEWDRVNKLCDFNAKNTRNAKDLSRMRSILLQLKQNPKPVLLA